MALGAFNAMALPGKNTRKITVGDTAYRWAVYPKKDEKQLRVELYDEPASQLFAALDLSHSGAAASFTPGIVASIIMEALARGWRPDRRDPAEFQLEGVETLKSVDALEARRQISCMVIAPLDHAGDRIRDTVARTVRELGMQVRDPLDREMVQFSVAEHAIKAIIESDVVVADISRQNPNVMYEVGWAHALRKATILIVEDGNIKIPPALSGHLYLTYDTTNLENFKQKLAKTILRSVNQSLV